MKKDTLVKIIEKYQNRPSTKIIKAKNKSQTFWLKKTNIDETKKSIRNLDSKIASQKSDMNTNILRKNFFFGKTQFSLQIFTLN